MQLGIFSTVFERPTLAARLDAIRDAGFIAVQFHMQCAGLAPLPEVIDDALAQAIGAAHRARGLTVAALSGTFNMIHPDEGMRERGFAGLAAIARAAALMGAPVVTLCSGTWNTDSMWRAHPDNQNAAAWARCEAAMQRAAALGEQHGVIMAFEPEVANVLDSAVRARRMLDAIDSPWLKVVFDGANIFHHGELAQQHVILDEAIALLGRDIVHAHAKDLDEDGAAGKLAAGTGVLDYPHYLAGLRRAGFAGPLVLHGLAEAQVAACRAFVDDALARG